MLLIVVSFKKPKVYSTSFLSKDKLFNAARQSTPKRAIISPYGYQRTDERTKLFYRSGQSGMTKKLFRRIYSI